MSDLQAEERTREIMERADQLVRNAQQSLESYEQSLRSMGLDPQKVQAVLNAQPMTDAQREEAQVQFRKDMEDIEREVEQEAAYLRQRATPRSGAPARRHRTMV